jgi:carbamoylphosphate synthase large subunit
VIEKEKPDSILVSMGGQTALNVGVKLFEAGDLARHNVRVLGTQIPVIIATEDREMFSEKLAEIGETLALSYPAVTIDQVSRVRFFFVLWWEV